MIVLDVETIYCFSRYSIGLKVDSVNNRFLKTSNGQKMASFTASY